MLIINKRGKMQPIPQIFPKWNLWKHWTPTHAFLHLCRQQSLFDMDPSGICPLWPYLHALQAFQIWETAIDYHWNCWLRFPLRHKAVSPRSMWFIQSTPSSSSTDVGNPGDPLLYTVTFVALVVMGVLFFWWKIFHPHSVRGRLNKK